MGIRCADHVTPLYPQKLALTSPTGGGRSVGIVRSRTKATEFRVYPLKRLIFRQKQQLNTRGTQLSQDTTAQSHNDLVTGITTEKSWFESRDGQPIYLLLLNVQTDYVVNPASRSRIPQGYSGRDTMLATHPHKILRTGICGLPPPLHHMSFRRGSRKTTQCYQLSLFIQLVCDINQVTE